MTVVARPGTMGAMRRALMLLLVGLPFALASGSAWAKSSLTVRADKAVLSLGDALELRIRASAETSGNQQFDIVPPDLSAFDITGQGQSTRIDAFRGTRSTTITLTLKPKRAGKLVIGSFELKVPGNPAKSAPIRIEVRDGGVAAPSAPAAPGQAGPGAAPAEQAPDEVVYLKWQVDRDNVWLGEQIDARLYVFVREGIGVRDFKVGEIDLTGFWNQDRDQPRRPRTRKVTVGGLRFERQEVARYSLFPLRAGAPTLPEVKADMMVRRMRAFGGPRSIVTRVAAAVPLTVKPLPTAGRPKGFAGTSVGRTRLQATVDRRSIDAGEGVQLTVTTRVEGLIQNVPPIALPPLPDFKVFPATDDTRSDSGRGKLNGTRKQTWLLRPTKGGTLRIPSLTLPYFDPGRGLYDTARTATIRIQVSGEPGAVDSEDLPLPDDGPALRDIVADIEPGAGPRGGVGWWFQAVFVGAPLLFLLGWGRDRMRARRHATAGSRAARTAARDARAELVQIGRRDDDPRGGYSDVARAIVDYLETRFEAPFNGLTRDAVKAALVERGVKGPTADALIEELDACDFARFAPAADAASGLATAAERAADAIDAVEREVA